MWWQQQAAFTKHNLTRNPFGALTLHERGSLAVIEPIEIAPFKPVQIIADAGHGKTTHLLALRAQHPKSLYEYVNDPSLKTGTRGLFLVDEAQRLSAAELKRLFRTQALLVLGTHADLTEHSPHPLRTIRIASLSLEKLQAVVNARISAARRDSAEPVPMLTDIQLRGLMQRHGSNLRAIEASLYEAFQHGDL